MPEIESKISPERAFHQQSLAADFTIQARTYVDLKLIYVDSSAKTGGVQARSGATDDQNVRCG